MPTEDPLTDQLNRMDAAAALLPDPGPEAIRPLIAAVRAVLDLPRGHTPDPTGNDAFDRGYLRGYTTAIDNAQHAIQAALLRDGER